MKKLLALLIILLFPVVLMAQDGIFSQFLKKTRGASATLVFKGEGDKSIQWFAKPTAELNAVNLVYDKEAKKWGGSAFTAAGLGAGVQHYIEQNGVLVNDYGANVLFIINFNDPTNVGFGIAGTVNFIDFVNAGGGYDFTNKVPLILLGASWKF